MTSCRLAPSRPDGHAPLPRRVQAMYWLAESDLLVDENGEPDLGLDDVGVEAWCDTRGTWHVLGVCPQPPGHLATHWLGITGLLVDHSGCRAGLSAVLDAVLGGGSAVALPWWTHEAVRLADFCHGLAPLADGADLPDDFVEVPWDALSMPAGSPSDWPRLAALIGHLQPLRRVVLARLADQRPHWLLLRYAVAEAEEHLEDEGIEVPDAGFGYWLMRGALPGCDDAEDRAALGRLVDAALQVVDRAVAEDPLVAVFLREETDGTAHHAPPVAAHDQVRVLALPERLARRVRGDLLTGEHSGRTVQVRTLPDGWQRQVDRLHTTLALWSPDVGSPLYDAGRAWQAAAAVRGAPAAG